MNILFLDQSGKLGGAELCLLDIAKDYRDHCLVGLFADGSFRERLELEHIPVRVLTEQPIAVQKQSSLIQGLLSLMGLSKTIQHVIDLSQAYDVIYANTQKALVVGAIASFFSRRPLIYHLHDIVSLEHFSPINQRLIITLANQCAVQVIANSHASRDAFVAAGGQASKVQVVYNGFSLAQYQTVRTQQQTLRQSLHLEGKFVVGHFSRLSPWKGQHILMEALHSCPDSVVAILVGDALFGEAAYVAELHQQVERLGLGDRVQFLGFRRNVPELMAACDLVVHTSTAPEPFGRVIVEAMLCGTPVAAAAAGGAMELVQPGVTGWLTPPGDAQPLAKVIQACWQDPTQARTIAQRAMTYAESHFDLKLTNQQIHQCVQQVCDRTKSCQIPMPVQKDFQ